MPGVDSFCFDELRGNIAAKKQFDRENIEKKERDQRGRPNKERVPKRNYAVWALSHVLTYVFHAMRALFISMRASSSSARFSIKT